MKATSEKITPCRNVKKSIIAIGQSLIEKAEDIARDCENVTSISIYAKLDPTEIVNFDVTKNYYATYKEKKENDNQG